MKIIITEEQSEKLNQKVRFMVNKYGLEQAIELFDGREIIKHAYQDSPSEFLNQFNNLTPVKRDDKIYYVDKDRLPLFFYYRNDEYVYINYKIWGFYTNVVELENPEIEHIIKNWLEETYNIRGLKPYYNKAFYSYFWKTPII